jgi:hypothetical protein
MHDFISLSESGATLSKSCSREFKSNWPFVKLFDWQWQIGNLETLPGVRTTRLSFLTLPPPPPGPPSEAAIAAIVASLKTYGTDTLGPPLNLAN